jgi:hypothetical protein
MSIAYSIVAVACLAALWSSFRLWRTHRNAITLLILIPLLFLWLDNFAIAAGRWVGEGPLLTGMTYLRFFWHWAMLPLLFVVAGGLARRAGFAWAQPKAVMAAFCVVAVALMVLDVPHILDAKFYPACYGDTFRLTMNVPADQICDVANPPPKGMSVPPVAAIGINIVLMAIGFAMWWKHKFPWLALACIFMFVCAGSGAIPGFYWGQLLGNVGEPVFNAGLIAAGYRYAGLPAKAG